MLANAKVLIIFQYIDVSNQHILSAWNLYSALCKLYLKKKKGVSVPTQVVDLSVS